MTLSSVPPTDLDKSYFGKTIENVERLVRDAELLIEHERDRSAIMLGIFAIEEMGKALITLWGVKNKASKRPYPTHVEKQSATFALLAALEVCAMKRKKLAKILAKGPPNFNTMGPMNEQFAFARSGFFDDFRMAVTYADRDPKLKLEENEVEVGSSLATELLDWLQLAKRGVRNVQAMDLASTIYENDLGRL